MNSEKVKEIRMALCKKCDLSYSVNRQLYVVTNEDILTLINELESENKELNNELKRYKMDWLNSEKMHLQADMEDTEFELLCANKSLNEVRAENKQLKAENDMLQNKNYQLEQNLGQCENGYKLELHTERLIHKQLKDRIAELEKENAKWIKEVEDRKAEVLHLQEYGKKLIRETELKQFAERLKNKFDHSVSGIIYRTDSIDKNIDETLKEFINENATE